MRQLLATTVAALAVGLMLAAIGVPGAPSATARPLDPAQATATPPVSPCVPEYNKVAGPINPLLGATVTLTLTAKALCPAAPLHVVLVLPESADVPTRERERIQKSAEQLVADLMLPENPTIQVGVVAYATSVRTLCTLTNDERRVKACIRQLGATGTTAIDKGIDEGMKLLRRGRAGAGADLREVMIVYAGSRNTAGCDAVLSAASQVKGQKVLVMSVCAGDDCDASCIRQVASSPRYFFEAGDDIIQPFLAIGTSAMLRRLTITDKLPPHMAYVPGSANPAPSLIDPTDGIIWTFDTVPPSGVTVTLRVQPLEVGERPTNLEATGVLVDDNNAAKRFVFPVPMVNVRAQPSSTPTASPSATASPTNTVICTPPPCPCGVLVGSCPNLRCEVCTATATPNVTATPVSRSVYLPWLECVR